MRGPLLFLTAIFGSCAAGAAPVVFMGNDHKECRPAAQVQVFAHKRDLPKALRTKLDEDGRVADVGEAINLTDADPDPQRPFRRLLFVWHVNDWWLVATERGGFAHNFPIYTFENRADDVRLLEHKEVCPEDAVCSPAYSLVLQDHPIRR